MVCILLVKSKMNMTPATIHRIWLSSLLVLHLAATHTLAVEVGFVARMWW